jgi:hypothetical protein
MVCNSRTKGVATRHDLLLGAWHRIAHCVGVVAVIKAALERLWDGVPETRWHNDGATRRRLAGRRRVRNTPCCQQFRRWAAQQAGAAASRTGRGQAPEVWQQRTGGRRLLYNPVNGVVGAHGAASDAISARAGQSRHLLRSSWS